MADAISFQPTLDVINAKLAEGTPNGADAKLGAEIRDQIAKLGASLTSRFDASMAEAKSEFVSNLSSAHSAALRCAKFVFHQAARATGNVTVFDALPPDFGVNLYDTTAISERLAAAETLTDKTTNGAFLKRALAKHRAAVSSAFNAAGAYTEVPVKKKTGMPAATAAPSVADLERQIARVLTDAQSWLELVAFA